MKLPRFLIAGFAALVLAGCSLSMTGMVDLDPVPYSFHPPMGLESKLTVEPMTGEWADQAYAAGVTSTVTVTYTPEEGDPAILMGVYYMPESVFDGQLIQMNHLYMAVKWQGQMATFWPLPARRMRCMTLSLRMARILAFYMRLCMTQKAICPNSGHKNAVI
jgi:hypothetical protein